MTQVTVRVGNPQNRTRTCPVCGDPTPRGQRWCSSQCFGDDDGYPDEREDDDDG
jgi:hypothetical protein